jgi:hypothetical protein
MRSDITMLKSSEGPGPRGRCWDCSRQFKTCEPRFLFSSCLRVAPSTTSSAVLMSRRGENVTIANRRFALSVCVSEGRCASAKHATETIRCRTASTLSPVELQRSASLGWYANHRQVIATNAPTLLADSGQTIPPKPMVKTSQLALMCALLTCMNTKAKQTNKCLHSTISQTPLLSESSVC